MSLLDFQKPNEVAMRYCNNFQGTFEFVPLEKGYGATIGNALRRVLLSSLEGYTIHGICIEGVGHEFSTIKNIEEDVSKIILNLKKVRLKKVIGTENTDFHVRLEINGKQHSVFNAGLIQENSAEFEVLNPDLEICHLDTKAVLNMDLWICKGRGYVPAEEHQESKNVNGFIAIDSIFTPIRNVQYLVEDTRVEDKTDFEKLTITISTDGSINPKEALREASKILIEHLILFAEDNINFVKDPVKVKEPVDEDFLRMRKLLKTPVSDLILSVRAFNCLKSGNMETLGDIVRLDINDMMKFRNFGKKSLEEIQAMLVEKNLHFGMDVNKYKLDKD